LTLSWHEGEITSVRVGNGKGRKEGRKGGREERIRNNRKRKKN
jgi:hypothetical protein